MPVQKANTRRGTLPDPLALKLLSSLDLSPHTLTPIQEMLDQLAFPRASDSVSVHEPRILS